MRLVLCILLALHQSYSRQFQYDGSVEEVFVKPLEVCLTSQLYLAVLLFSSFQATKSVSWVRMLIETVVQSSAVYSLAYNEVGLPFS